MSLESSLFSTLNALAPAGGVWDGVGQDLGACPRIVFWPAASVPNIGMDYGGADLEIVRLQIDCYDTTSAGARALAASVKPVMVALQPTVRNWLINGGTYMYEQDVKQHRVMLEYGIQR